MSKKTEAVKARADGKSVYNISRLFGQRSGKAQDAALYEVYDEMSVYPPASKQEAEAFLRLHIKRCGMNLANAKSRGDSRAIVNLEKKLAIYQLMRDLLLKQVDPPVGARECPECRTHSVNSFGYCACCGKTF